MKVLKWVTRASLLGGFLIGGLACSPRSSSEGNLIAPTSKISDTIINGTEVSANHPIARMTVAIYNPTIKATCSGSLLENNIVLTAAHCVYSNPKKQFILFESNFSSTDPAVMKKFKFLPVIAGKVTPTWEKQQHLLKNQGDIGLLKFSGQVPPGYQAARALRDFKVLKKGTSTVIAGYGRVQFQNTNVQVLRQATVPIADPQFSQLEITLDQSRGYGACVGDSGGPAYVILNGIYYLWGVTSRPVDMSPEDQCQNVGVFTKVDRFLSWISTATKELIEEEQ